MGLQIGAFIVPNLFPLFIYTLFFVIDCLTIHLCMMRFTFKTPIEALLVISLLTWIQFLLVALVKFGGHEEFDTTPWGMLSISRLFFLFYNTHAIQVSKLQKCANAFCARAERVQGDGKYEIGKPTEIRRLVLYRLCVCVTSSLL